MTSAPRQPDAQGDLNRFPIPRLLFFLLKKAFLGEVEIAAHANLRGRVYLRNGMPVFADLPSSRDVLGRVLLERGLIDEQAFNRSLQELASGKKLQGQILIAMGALDARGLVEGLRVQLYRKLNRLFALREATITIWSGEHAHGVEGEEAQLQADPLRVIYHGVRNAFDGPRLALELDRLRGHAIKLRPGFERRQPRYGMNEEELALITLLARSSMTLEQLLRVSNLGDIETRMLLYTLWVTEALAATPTAAAAATRAAGEEAAVPAGDFSAPQPTGSVRPAAQPIGPAPLVTPPLVTPLAAEEDPAPASPPPRPRSATIPNVQALAMSFAVPEEEPNPPSPSPATLVTPPPPSVLVTPSPAELAAAFMDAPAEASPMLVTPPVDLPVDLPPILVPPPPAVLVPPPPELASPAVITPPPPAELAAAFMPPEVGVIDDPQPVIDLDATGPSPGAQAIGLDSTGPSLPPALSTLDGRAASRQSLDDIVSGAAEAPPLAAPRSASAPTLPSIGRPASPSQPGSRLKKPSAQMPPAAVTPQQMMEHKQLIKRAFEGLKDKNHFQVLEVARTAATELIRDQYFKLAKVFHPDRCAAMGVPEATPAAAEIFRRVNEAHTVLANADARKAYEEELDGGGDKQEVRNALEAEFVFQKGVIFFRKKNYAEAFKHFEESYRLNEKEGEHLAWMAWATFHDPRNKRDQILPKVKEMLLRAIKIAPQNATCHYYLGEIYLALGDEKRAKTCFTRTVECQEGHIEANRHLRLMQMRKEKEKKSTGLFGRINISLGKDKKKK
jgi:curved DNA-binding protein CbpA